MDNKLFLTFALSHCRAVDWVQGQLLNTNTFVPSGRLAAELNVSPFGAMYVSVYIV